MPYRSDAEVCPYMEGEPGDLRYCAALRDMDAAKAHIAALEVAIIRLGSKVSFLDHTKLVEANPEAEARIAYARSITL